MTRLAGSPTIDATRPALTDVSHQAPGLEKEPCDIASVHLMNPACAVADCWSAAIRQHWKATSPADRSKCGDASTAATAWIVTFWPTDGRVLSRYIHAQDHGQGLNTPEVRA
jgi:hypothetical protein